jgi:hypothetical protein
MAEPTLNDTLLLLSKVTSNLGTEVTKIKKMLGEKPSTDKETKISTRDNNVDKKKNIDEKKLSHIEKLLGEQIKESKEKDKPEQIVDKAPESIITSFGRTAEDQLTKILKGSSDTDKKPKAKEQEKEKKGGMFDILKNLLTPSLLTLLSGLSGLLTVMFQGGFGKVIDMFEKGGIVSGMVELGKVIYKAVRAPLHSMPIIGPLLSLFDAYNSFNKGNLIEGLNNLLQGAIGLLPIPKGMKVALFTGMDVLSVFLQEKYGKETIPTNTGGTITMIMKSMGMAFKSLLKMGGGVGKITSTLLKNNPILKRIPILGSLFNFAAAINYFTSETPSSEGLIQALMNIAAGVAGFFPGIGTAISIGIDFLNMLLFTKEDVKDSEGKVVGKKVTTRDWFIKTMNWIADSFPIKNLIQFGTGLGDIISGDYKEGLTKIAYSIPGVGFITSLLGGPATVEEAVIQKTSPVDMFKKFLNDVKKKLISKVLSMFPESFGIRNKVAGMLGVDTDAPSEEEWFKTEEGQAAAKRIEAAKQEQATTSSATASMYGQGYKTNDFIKTPDGRLIEPNKNDTIIGLKPGGPLDEIFSKQSKIASENNTILKQLADVQNDLLTKQLGELFKNNMLLADIKSSIGNLSPNIITSQSKPNISESGPSYLRRMQTSNIGMGSLA